MRRKKHKAARRIIRHYKLHFGFREPFKVLLDGNFLHALCQLKYDNIESIISTLLGGKVKLFVPSCVARELRTLAKHDKTLSEAAALSRKFVRHKDGCPPDQPNVSCLLKQVGDGNNQHWLIATQDKDLSATLQQEAHAAVPVIYATVTGVHLTPPSDRAKGAIAQEAQARMHSNPEERTLLKAPDDATGERERSASLRGRKRRRAQAPNPLAVKAKAPKKAPETVTKVRRKR